ncbi:MAG: metallophosphoesterase family protein [Myxococcales bacterium]|nr:metallophosphoesterase family protein [Myxococcales bacterium]
MRVGIFSDVHANIEALTAVTAALSRESVDVYYCLGDVVGYGASPNECCDLVRALAQTTIVGNHDAAVAGRMDYSYYYDAARHALDTHASQLSAENMTWLKGLPYKYNVSTAGLLLCHGSPVRLEEFDYIFAPEQAAECLEIWDTLPQLTVIGHSHLCKVFALKPHEVKELPADSFVLEDGYKYVTSVGSVGQPRDHDNRAAYGIFDSATREFFFRRVEYDIEAAAEKVFASGLEHNFGHRLFIGV